MSEMGLQSLLPHSGTQVVSLLENNHSSPDAKRKPLSGKSFYLDLPAGKNLQFLMRAIQQLGGVIESFLSKEVSYIITSRREPKTEKSGMSCQGFDSLRKIRMEMTSASDPKGGQKLLPKPRDAVPLSRGKELLQKAIRNQGSTSASPGGSSNLLTSARSWGVEILHVDEMLLHVQQLCLDILHMTEQEKKKPKKTCAAVESRALKVARLKAPFLKIEDSSRKFQPFYHQFKCFPELGFLRSKDLSPFETLRPSFHKRKAKDPEDNELSPQSTVCTVPRRKKGYCECCQEDFEELCVHLQSDQHRNFAMEASNYTAVDQIASQLSNNFAELSIQIPLPRLPGSSDVGLHHQTPAPLQELPLLSHSPDARASSPRSDGDPESLNEKGIDRPPPDSLGLLAPADQTVGGGAAGAGASEGPKPLNGALGCSLEAPLLAHQLTLACAASVELLAKPPSCDKPAAPPFFGEQDRSLMGHKRKLQSPTCRAEKKFRVPADALHYPSTSEMPVLCPLVTSPNLTMSPDILLASPVGSSHESPSQHNFLNKLQRDGLCSGLPALEVDIITKASQDTFFLQEGIQRAPRLSPCQVSGPCPCPDHHSHSSHPTCPPGSLLLTCGSEKHLQGTSLSSSLEDVLSPSPSPPLERRGNLDATWQSVPSVAPASSLSAKVSSPMLVEHCSSESEWDMQLLSKLDRPQASRDRSLDAEGLRRARIVILDSGYESHLYSVLQPKPELDWERKEQNQENCHTETDGVPLS